MDKFNQICDDIKSLKIQGAVNVARKGLEAYSLRPNKASIRKLLSLRPTEPMLRNVLEYAERFSVKDVEKLIEKHFEKILFYGKAIAKIYFGNPLGVMAVPVGILSVRLWLKNIWVKL